MHCNSKNGKYRDVDKDNDTDDDKDQYRTKALTMVVVITIIMTIHADNHDNIGNKANAEIYTDNNHADTGNT